MGSSRYTLLAVLASARRCAPCCQVCRCCHSTSRWLQRRALLWRHSRQLRLHNRLRGLVRPDSQLVSRSLRGNQLPQVAKRPDTPKLSASHHRGWLQPGKLRNSIRRTLRCWQEPLQQMGHSCFGDPLSRRRLGHRRKSPGQLLAPDKVIGMALLRS